MPKASKFEITRLDSAGNAIVGAVIELHEQGATVSAGGPTSFTVDSPGSLRATANVLGVSADGLTERSGLVNVSSVTATNVTTGMSISGMVNNDRIVSDITATIFKDEMLNESAGTSIVTDSNGYASGYVNFQAFDIESTGGTSPLGAAVKKYWFDVYPSSGRWKVFYDFPTGSQVIRRYDSSDALLSGDRFVEYRANNVVKWYVDLNTSLVARLPAHNIAGILTIDSGGLTVASGTITLPAGSLETSDYADLSVSTAKLALNAVHPVPVTITGSSSDVVLTTSEVVRLTTSYTPVADNVGVLVTVNIPYEANGSTNTGGRVEARLYIGGALKTRGFIGGNTGANEIWNDRGTISFLWMEPAMAASPTTIEVREIRVDTAGTTTGTYKGTIFAGTMTIQELKK